MIGARRAVALLGGVVLLAGCGAGGADESTRGSDVAPAVRVRSGGQDVAVQPTQYCLAGEGKRYSGTPPIIEVAPEDTIALTVDPAVAAHGWSVQVYDDQLEDLIGEVDVGDDVETFTGITSSDIVPPAFYLVVVEASDAAQCNGLSGAWPIGFVRSGEGETSDGSTPRTATDGATPTPTTG